jgi:tetratricopeptide (TPR) repeat protein
MADEVKRDIPAGQTGQSEGVKNNELDERLKTSIEAAKAELRAEAYKKSVDNLKWALGIIVTLVGITAALVLVVLFKNTGEYRQAVEDARYASKEARESSNRAREWEDKARERFSEINEVVEVKLKEIEDKSGTKLKKIEDEGKVVIANLIKEGERQQRASDALNAGLRAMREEDYERAASEFSKVVGMGLESPVVYNNWGMALLNWAEKKEGTESEKLLGEACEKFKKAIEIKPDLPEAYNVWGNALGDLAKNN